MADTQRTLTAILALLVDNTSGDISPQDVRDTLVTLQNGMGEISITSAAATTLADTSTWVQAAGTYSLTAGGLNWAMTQSGRLYYTGTAARMCHIAMSVSMTSGSNNQVTEWGIGKDGSIITPSIVQRKVGTGTDVGSTAVHAFTSIANGEYLTGMCRNTTAANDVTATTLNLFVMDMAT